MAPSGRTWGQERMGWRTGKWADWKRIGRHTDGKQTGEWEADKRMGGWESDKDRQMGGGWVDGGGHVGWISGRGHTVGGPAGQMWANRSKWGGGGANGADRVVDERIDVSTNAAIENPMCPSSCKCKNRPFTSIVTITTRSVTMSCCHHASFVMTF